MKILNLKRIEKTLNKGPQACYIKINDYFQNEGLT